MSPFQVVVAILCGWVQREQNDVIAFLREENRILKARLKGRLRFRAKGGGREETESEWRTRTSQNGRYVDQTPLMLPIHPVAW